MENIYRYIEEFLNRKWVRKELGIDSAAGNFSGISWPVNQAFWATGDPLHQTEHYVAQLLERGIKVLIYAGTYDFICNWVGIERWTLEMAWSGQDGFRNQPLAKWLVDGKTAGITRSFGNFTFATIYGAGHMVSLLSTCYQYFTCLIEL